MTVTATVIHESESDSHLSGYDDDDDDDDDFDLKFYAFLVLMQSVFLFLNFVSMFFVSECGFG